MNTALKPLVDEVFDVEAVAEDGVAKNWAQLASDGLKAIVDAPALVQNAKGIKDDLVALVSDGGASAADLASYVGGKLSSKKPEVAAVASAALDLGLTGAVKVMALVKAIQALKAAQAPVAAPSA